MFQDQHPKTSVLKVFEQAYSYKHHCSKNTLARFAFSCWYFRWLCHGRICPASACGARRATASSEPRTLNLEQRTANIQPSTANLELGTKGSGATELGTSNCGAATPWLKQERPPFSDRSCKPIPSPITSLPWSWSSSSSPASFPRCPSPYPDNP